MIMRKIRHIRWARMRLLLTWIFMNMSGSSLAFAAEGNTNIVPGIGLLRGIGIVSALGGIIVLVLVHFVYRNKLSRGTYHWLLLLGLFVLPNHRHTQYHRNGNGRDQTGRSLCVLSRDGTLCE